MKWRKIDGWDEYSVQDAADDCKIDRSGISDVLHGRRKTAGGYHWAFHSEVRKCS